MYNKKVAGDTSMITKWCRWLFIKEDNVGDQYIKHNCLTHLLPQLQSGICHQALSFFTATTKNYLSKSNFKENFISCFYKNFINCLSSVGELWNSLFVYRHNKSYGRVQNKILMNTGLIFTRSLSYIWLFHLLNSFVGKPLETVKWIITNIYWFCWESNYIMHMIKS